MFVAMFGAPPAPPAAPPAAGTPLRVVSFNQLYSNRRVEDILAAIRAHTRVLTRYDELETTRDYPVPVKKLLTRLSRIRLDRLLYKIL